MKNLFVFLFLLSSVNAIALDGTHFTISRVSAPYFVVDANSPATITRAYVGFKVRNSSNSAVTYSSLKFTITSITSSVTGQNYALLSPTSGVTNIGTLAPGQSKTCYYYVSYPASVTPQGTFNVTLSDATANSKSQSIVIRNRSSISANAGGTATQAISNQDLIGATVVDDVTYVVGNAQNGDENDFQVAVTSQFDPTKLTLLSTQIISSSIPGIPATTADSLYFISTGGSNGATVTVRWTFRITSFDFTLSLLPSAGATSGGSNYKYALNTSLGAGTPVTVSASANKLAITKTSDKTTYLINSTAIFTVTIQNTGGFNTTIDKLTDLLPQGFQFVSLDVSSQVTTANSTTLPAGGSTGLVTFEGGVSSGANSSYVIAPGGSLILRYTATAPAAPASSLSSVATGYVGTTVVGTAQRTVSVVAVLPVELISFKAKEESGGNHLSWTTARESKSSYFEIQRSNGGGFQVMARLAASGTSTSNKNYDYTDISAPEGGSSYRLRIVDVDDQFEYSSVAVVKRSLVKKDAVSQASASPFSETLKMSLSLVEASEVKFQLFDMNGKVAASRVVTAAKGSSTITLDNLSIIRSGIYILSVQTPRQLFTFKVSKL